MIHVRWVRRPRAGRDDFAIAQAAPAEVQISLPVLAAANRLFARLVDAGEMALANARKQLGIRERS